MYANLELALARVDELVQKKDYCWFHLVHGKIGNMEGILWQAYVEQIHGRGAEGDGYTPLEAVNSLLENWEANQAAGGF